MQKVQTKDHGFVYDTIATAATEAASIFTKKCNLYYTCSAISASWHKDENLYKKTPRK